jgi:DNA-binding PadR family transcriptional regulator
VSPHPEINKILVSPPTKSGEQPIQIKKPTQNPTYIEKLCILKPGVFDMAFRGDINALILATLQGEPLHGYEIVRRIRQTGFARRLSEGQMYPVFHELERVGMLRAEWLTDDAALPRRVYAITQTGTAEIARPRSLWERLASGVGFLLQSGLKTMEVENA